MWGGTPLEAQSAAPPGAAPPGVNAVRIGSLVLGCILYPTNQYRIKARVDCSSKALTDVMESSGIDVKHY